MANLQTMKSRWLRDLVRFLPLKSQFLGTGNIRDLQAYEIESGVVAAVPLIQCLDRELRLAGYNDVIAFQPFSGFSMPGGTFNGDMAQVAARTGLGSENANGVGVEALTDVIEGFVASNGAPAALIIDFASRLDQSWRLARDQRAYPLHKGLDCFARD